MPSQLVLDNFRVNKLPHIWCPGCGHGILMRAITVAIDEKDHAANRPRPRSDHGREFCGGFLGTK